MFRDQLTTPHRTASPQSQFQSRSHPSEIGDWIAENHDPAVDDSKTCEPDASTAAAYDAAYALYEERGKALFD